MFPPPPLHLSRRIICSNVVYILDDDGGEDPSIEVSNSQPSQVIYEKESKIKIDYALLEEGRYEQIVNRIIRVFVSNMPSFYKFHCILFRPDRIRGQ